MVPGSSGRLNFFWEPMAAGKGGAENMAATVLIRVIQDCICSAFLITHTDRQFLAQNIKGLVIRERSPAVDKEAILEPIKAGEERVHFTAAEPPGAREENQMEPA